MQLGRIEIFPIKSLDGVMVEKARITPGGIIENDRIYAMLDSEGRYFRKFTDKSVLDIFDRQNVEILNIRFLRPNLFQITGHIHFPDGTEMLIATNGLMYGRTIFQDFGLRGNAGFNINENGTLMLGGQ